MQSFLQFKRAGRAAQVHIEQARQRAAEHGGNAEQPIGAKNSSNSEKQRVDTRGDNASDEDAARDVEALEPTRNLDLAQTKSNGAAIARALTGVNVQTSTLTTTDSRGNQVFIVGWEGPDDPENPRNWTTSRRVIVMLQISLIGLGVGATSGIDSAVLPQAAEEFGVSRVVESVSVGMSRRKTSLSVNPANISLKASTSSALAWALSSPLPSLRRLDAMPSTRAP
jgi:hypothetical protein